jgi:hypothetical protein
MIVSVSDKFSNKIYLKYNTMYFLSISEELSDSIFYSEEGSNKFARDWYPHAVLHCHDSEDKDKYKGKVPMLT